MTSSLRSRKPARVYHVSAKMASKTCAKCGQQLKAGQKIKFSSGTTVSRGTAPVHTRCPQRPITTRVLVM